ncbi:uncharacterized protein BX664DRAFT_383949, partial [Halteromyces radiatus]|uniref:uncharacterized protein n=1 Tax=Halteromyces radiatus TaxID=101107 RepID=UPI002220122B
MSTIQLLVFFLFLFSSFFFFIMILFVLTNIFSQFSFVDTPFVFLPPIPHEVIPPPPPPVVPCSVISLEIRWFIVFLVAHKNLIWQTLQVLAPLMIVVFYIMWLTVCDVWFIINLAFDAFASVTTAPIVASRPVRLASASPSCRPPQPIITTSSIVASRPMELASTSPSYHPPLPVTTTSSIVASRPMELASASPRLPSLSQVPSRPPTTLLIDASPTVKLASVSPPLSPCLPPPQDNHQEKEADIISPTVDDVCDLSVGLVPDVSLPPYAPLGSLDVSAPLQDQVLFPLAHYTNVISFPSPFSFFFSPSFGVRRSSFRSVCRPVFKDVKRIHCRGVHRVASGGVRRVACGRSRRLVFTRVWHLAGRPRLSAGVSRPPFATGVPHPLPSADVVLPPSSGVRRSPLRGVYRHRYHDRRRVHFRGDHYTSSPSIRHVTLGHSYRLAFRLAWIFGYGNGNHPFVRIRHRSSASPSLVVPSPSTDDVPSSNTAPSPVAAVSPSNDDAVPPSNQPTHIIPSSSPSRTDPPKAATIHSPRPRPSGRELVFGPAIRQPLIPESVRQALLGKLAYGPSSSSDPTLASSSSKPSPERVTQPSVPKDVPPTCCDISRKRKAEADLDARPIPKIIPRTSTSSSSSSSSSASTSSSSSSS